MKSRDPNWSIEWISSPDDRFLQIGSIKVHQVLVDEPQGHGQRDEAEESAHEHQLFLFCEAIVDTLVDNVRQSEEQEDTVQDRADRTQPEAPGAPRDHVLWKEREGSYCFGLGFAGFYVLAGCPLLMKISSLAEG